MENTYRFFQNKQCQYFPCHKKEEPFNCLFCFCPLYTKEKCPGNPNYIESKGKRIKDCSNCVFPHCPENYEKIIQEI